MVKTLKEISFPQLSNARDQHRMETISMQWNRILKKGKYAGCFIIIRIGLFELYLILSHTIHFRFYYFDLIYMQSSDINKKGYEIDAYKTITHLKCS